MKTVNEVAYLLQIEDTPRLRKPKHKFGGLPEGLRRGAVPPCVNCHHPLHLFFQIDLSDPTLSLTLAGMPYLFIMSCLNCDSYCSPLYYRVGKDCLSLGVLEQARAEHFGEFPPLLDEKGLSFAPLARPWTDDDERKHQFGGYPFWIQEAYVPECKLCGKEMQFVAQVDSDLDAGVQFGDMGILYAFLCQPCSVLATFMQCY